MPSVCLIDTLLSVPPFGGPSFFLGQLATQLRGRGWDVSIVTQRGPDPRVRDELVRDGLNVVEGPWKPWHLPEKKGRLLSEWVKNTTPDVFVISNCQAVSWLTLPLLPETVRTVSIAHHDVSAYYNPVGHYFSFIDLAVGVSPQIRDRLALLPGAEPDRCQYIPYGVDVLDMDRARAKVQSAVARPFKIGYVGRIVETQKRVMSLPPLLRRLASKKMPFHFHVLGDGPDRVALEQSFADHGVSDQVSFLGWLEGAELRRRLEELDVLVMVSESEGLPIAMLEAMGHAVVPVVSDVDSGMSRVVEDGRNGFLVDFGDLATYADRIESLFHDANLLRTMQSNSWETGQEFKAERMGAAYEATFQKLLEPSFDHQHRPRTTQFPVMESCRSRYPFWVRRVKSRVRHLCLGPAG